MEDKASDCVAAARQQNTYRRSTYSFVKREVHLHTVRVHRYCSTDLQKLYCIILVNGNRFVLRLGRYVCTVYKVY